MRYISIFYYSPPMKYKNECPATIILELTLEKGFAASSDTVTEDWELN